MENPKLKKSLPIHSMTRHYGLVLTDDDQLRTFAHTPDVPFSPKVTNTAMPVISLREALENASRGHSEILTFFHDHFFGGGQRTLHLTHPEFVECTRLLSEHAAEYGMGIGASVTNPLDLGRTFKDDMGTGGQHRFFADGLRHEDGSFSFLAPMPAAWCNNKGLIYPAYDHARLFAYTVQDDGSPYLVIDPDLIHEIDPADYTVEVSEEPYDRAENFGNRHMVITGKTALPGNRVFSVLYMNTPEMDYFHPGVTEYVHGVIDMYREQGVEFLELYSDEMHIQFDWNFAHFGPREMPTRYMTENFQRRLAREDPLFADFDIALIYMGYDMPADREALERPHMQHVIGRSPEALFRTFRLRRTYFEMLQDQVVGICCDARDYIRSTYVKNAGADPLCLGHATWQESPTCDKYIDLPGAKGMFNNAMKAGACTYDYTPDYVYSSTIREAISGCYDYFKWNDYFSYGGNDFCECSWFDRNYYGGAMAASLGALNRNEVGSWGSWGFPNEVRRRFDSVDIAFGTHRNVSASIVSWGRPRIVDVLMLYPKDLTACEERFGSWMVQYGYCNYCPADRMLRLGKIENGELVLGLGRYRTIVAAFEPFYNETLLERLEEFAEQGGNVIWMSAPPCDETGRVPERFLRAFGLETATPLTEGKSAYQVRFEGDFASLAPMKVLTDMLVDRIYPITTGSLSTPIAFAQTGTGNMRIGAMSPVGDGKMIYIGCRLRDDQSGDSGDAPSTLFDFLKRAGAYGGPLCKDNTETISRHSSYFCTKFANGTISVANHFRGMKEYWAEGFHRDENRDAMDLSGYPYMAPVLIDFMDKDIEGHMISYRGEGVLQYRLDGEGRLVGYHGDGCPDYFIVDGDVYAFTDDHCLLIFNEIEADRLPEGCSQGWIVQTSAPEVRLPFAIPASAKVYRDTLGDGTQLDDDPALSLDGSRLTMGGVFSAVILA